MKENGSHTQATPSSAQCPTPGSAHTRARKTILLAAAGTSYAGKPWQFRIGAFQSQDGLAFTPHPDNPIFVPAEQPAWDSGLVTHPMLLPALDGSGCHLFYVGGINTGDLKLGHAFSDDCMTNWQRNPANPIGDGGSSGEGDE